MVINTPRKTYFKDNDFQIEYQEYGKVVYIHADVYNWNPRVARKGYIVFTRMQNECKNMGFFQLVAISPNPEFCKMYGGYSLERITHENKEYEVMVWELKSL